MVSMSSQQMNSCEDNQELIEFFHIDFDIGKAEVVQRVEAAALEAIRSLAAGNLPVNDKSIFASVLCATCDSGFGSGNFECEEESQTLSRSTQEKGIYLLVEDNTGVHAAWGTLEYHRCVYTCVDQQTLNLVSRNRKDAWFVAMEEISSSAAGRKRRKGGFHDGDLVEMRLQNRSVCKDFTSRGGGSAYRCMRVFRILDIVHELLLKGKQATQREIYYRVASPPVFTTVNDVNEAIQDTVALLRVPRQSLGISSSPKGAVAGLLQLKSTPLSHWEDCSNVGMMGRPLPGDASAIQQMMITTTARYVIVVEKDAIFQRLVEDKLFETLPSILVTGKGMPDLATRIFLNKLHKMHPHLVFFGLFDWNPSGISILSIYKYGSPRGLESTRYALPSLKWLGVHSRMIENVLDTSFQPLSRRDVSLLQTLTKWLGHKADWVEELEAMQEMGQKCEIEGVYDGCGIEGLTELLTSSILKRQFLD